MNETQKIIIQETIGLGFSIPSEISIVVDYLIPAIKESGLEGVFGSLMNLLLFITTLLLTYASYQWIINIAENIDKTERLMYYDKNRFYNFLAKIVVTFFVTFFVVLFIKNQLRI